MSKRPDGPLGDVATAEIGHLAAYVNLVRAETICRLARQKRPWRTAGGNATSLRLLTNPCSRTSKNVAVREPVALSVLETDPSATKSNLKLSQSAREPLAHQPRSYRERAVSRQSSGRPVQRLRKS